jgi:Abnormal spindle-like microcephaly-assoc'd, ASPM-SPD-2-Hydin/CARDB
MKVGMCQLSRGPGIRRNSFALMLCLLVALVAGLGLSGCTGVTQQTQPPQASPQISVVPSSITFNNVVVGQKSSQTVQISNTGNATLNVTSISLTGSGFSLSPITVPFQVASGASMNFTVTFTASSTTSASATLTITSDAPGSPLSVAVQGTGQSASASWQMSPSSITFPNTTVQTAQTQNASIKNNGNVAVTISAVNLTGAAFSTTGLSSGMTLSAGQQLNFQVSFTPTVTGSATGSLSVSSGASPSALTMSLSGSGVNAATQHTVTLTWSASTGASGYHIYRSTVSGGPYSMLNPTLDAQTSYTDATVQSGATYFYVATSVDSSGSESAYSNEASAVIPNP